MKRFSFSLLFICLLLANVPRLPAQQKRPGADEVYYSCPMHPDVTSETGGKCSRCGMIMMKTRRPEEAEYDVQIKTNPALVKPNEKFLLTFDIRSPKSGAAIKDFNIFHDMPFHLFVVSQDLNHFAHLHPSQGTDGRFSVETSLPKAGAYLIFCDIFPIGGLPHVVQRNLVTSGFKVDLLGQRTRLKPDQVFSQTLSGIRFELSFNPSLMLGGKSAKLNYRLLDDKTGEPVVDLQPYLGAWGHTLILSEDGRDYIHSHPSELIPDSADRSRMRGGPNVSFEAFLPRAGRYRIWSQFQRQNKVVTVSFTIEAKGY